MNKVRVAILGAGAMGQVHAAAYATMPDVQVEGPFRRDELLTTAAALMEDPAVDAFDVCLPTFMHCDYVGLALAHGKHVFCETPLAHSLGDAHFMRKGARRVGKLLQVGLLMRAVAAYRHVKQATESGEHGRLLSLSTWRLGSYLRPDSPGHKAHHSDPPLELMTFDFDFALWLMGKPARLRAWGEGDMAALLEWDDGRHASIAASGLMPVDTPFTVGFRALFEDASFEHETVFDGPGPPRSHFNVPVADANPYEVELRHFVDCVRGHGDRTLLDVDRAIEALELSLEARRQVGKMPQNRPISSPCTGSPDS